VKIGFLCYSLFVLERYWQELEGKADCWWAVTQQDTLRELEERGMKKVVFCPDELQYIPDRKGNKYVSVAPGQAEKELVERVAPDIWITDQTNRLTYAPKSSYWIQTFHSLCFKKHTFHPLTLEYDVLLLPGDYHRREFVRRLGFAEGDERLRVIGWPRVDDLVQPKYDREEVLASLGLDPSRKTVMYAPTWGGYEKDMRTWGRHLFARWFGRDREIFESLCSEVREMKLNLIVKLHHLSACASDEELRKIAGQVGAVWVTEAMSNHQIDPNPFLWATDVLISDMSGIAMDYMVLDRPIVFIDPDETIDAWKECSIPATFRAGEIVQTPEQLTAAIRGSVESPERYSAERRRVLGQVFSSLDGRAASRAAEAISSFAREKGLS
jgi:CDP-glycerol glycerophosphotransferase (TagB/SpsB family)